MNAGIDSPADRDALVENFAAELSERVMAVALRHGVGRSWLDLKLDLWRALIETLKEKPRYAQWVRNPRGFAVGSRLKLLAVSSLIVVALAAILLSRMSAGTGQATDGENRGAEAGKESKAPFAVVELFTSEGCSSCPPADILLAQIVQDAREHRRRVFGLAFHVDYWNHLGWNDAYSAPAFSRRQQAYAQAFKNDQVYTPQMIVNGGEEFVGSDRVRSRAGIDAALKRPARAFVKLQQDKPNTPNSLAIAFAVAGAARGDALHVTVVESGLSSEVNRGENAGRTLRHDNVVRAFKTVRLDEGGKGSVELNLPADLVHKNASLIAYVQEAGPGAVLGATAMGLAPDAQR